MIAMLRGEVLDRGVAEVVVDVQGVGYRVLVPAGLAIPLPGREIVLHTSLQVREDSLTLYGFLERAELRLFELLLTCSGVGPKLALAALSALRPAVLEAAIADADLAVLTGVPGIGRKVAERIVLELKDRIGTVIGAPAGSVAAADDAPIGAVREALAGFGFTPVEVREALARIEVVPDEDSGTLLRRALRMLGRGPEGGV
jgi:Holliday junction DNA helicase RuvA